MFFSWKNKIEEAEEYYEKGDYTKALDCICQVETGTESQELLQLRIKIYKALEKYEDAINDTILLLKFMPDSPNVLNNIANLYYKLSEYEKAIEYYDKALLINPQHELSAKNKSIAKNKLSAKRKELLKDKYDNYKKNKDKKKYIQNTLQEAYYYIDKAKRNLTSQDYLNAKFNYERSIKFFEYVLQEEPNNIEAVQGKQNAENDYQTCLKDYDNYKKLLHLQRIQEIRDLISTEQFEDAIVEINELLEYQPQDLELLHLKAHAYFNIHLYKKTIEIYSIILKIEPNAETYLLRGLLYIELENFKEAIEDITKSIDLGNNTYNCYYNRARCYLFLLKIDEAINDLDMAIQINPTSDAYALKAACYVKQGNKEKIKENFLRAKELETDSTEFYSELIDKLDSDDNFIIDKIRKQVRKLDL